MTSEYFAELYEYDSYVNGQVLELLRSIPEATERMRAIMAHMLQAQKLWMRRLRGEDYQNIVIWPTLSWDECEKLIDESREEWQSFLREITPEELEGTVTYRNSAGKEFVTPVREIMTHVIVHGGYHRGQLAMAVRDLGGEPINTDYISYRRMKAGQL